MYNLDNDVPEHRKLIVGGTTLILDEDVSIKCSSKYGPLWEAQPSNLLNLLSNSFGTPSGQFALQGLQIWQSTDPLTVDVSGTRYMNTDPYTDVITPVSALMQICLPKLSDGTGTVAEFIDDFVEEKLGLKLMTLIPPGPNIQYIASQIKSGNESGLLTGALDALSNVQGGPRGIATVKIGNFTFSNSIITSVEPTFSKEVAKSTSKGKYYPISANVSITFTSVMIPTPSMIANIMG